MFRGSKSKTAPILMYTSFLTLSLLDGSLSNHVVSSASLALLFLTCYDPSPLAWERAARRALVWFAAILYLVTGIHKLNDGFFDPHYSCASLYVSGSVAWIPLFILQLEPVHAFISFLVRFAPHTAVIFELGMPFCLLLSTIWDTKNLTLIRSSIFIGATFHAVLALPPSPLSVYPFSSIMVPIYLLIIPAECTRIEKFVNWWTWSTVAILVVIVAIISRHATDVLFNEEDLFEYPNYGLWAVSVVWNLIAWALVIASVLSVTERTRPVKKTHLRLASCLVILGLFLFGLTPYIGMRNYPALAMFSNLRTEGTNPNHWIPSWDFFGYQKDYVEVVATNIPGVRDMEINLGGLFPEKLKATNTLFGLSNEFYICPPKWPYQNRLAVRANFSMPFIEFRRRISKIHGRLDDDSFIEYMRRRPGIVDSHVLLTPSNITFAPDIVTPISLFEEYFVKFRSFSDSYSPCRH